MNATVAPRNRHTARRAAALAKLAQVGPFLEGHLSTFKRADSRNAFDEHRNTGAAPWNLGELCGQPASDPRFAGHRRLITPQAISRRANSEVLFI